MTNPSPPNVLQRIRAEYLEMPGLTLKAAQVQRLCGVDDATCQLVLGRLVETGFLSMRPDGSYRRFTDPDIARAHPAKTGRKPGVHTTNPRIPRAS